MNFKDALDNLMAGEEITRMARITNGLRGWSPGWDGYSFSKEEICADDWVVIPKKVTITKEDLENAWKRMELSGKSSVLVTLAKELGL